MDELEGKLYKLKVNTTRAEAYDQYVVLDMLEEQGDKWRIIWEELPTLMQFDQLYGSGAMFEAFIYQGVLFERKTMEPMIRRWEPTDGNSMVLDWMLDHPPFECCVPLADLFRHSVGLKEEASPWVLYILLTEASDEASIPEIFSSLIPIGTNDAVCLGRALEMWGEYADVIDIYSTLLKMFDQRITDQ